MLTVPDSVRQTDIFITREELILYDDWRRWDAMRLECPITRLFWVMLMFATSLFSLRVTTLGFYFSLCLLKTSSAVVACVSHDVILMNWGRLLRPLA